MDEMKRCVGETDFDAERTFLTESIGELEFEKAELLEENKKLKERVCYLESEHESGHLIYENQLLTTICVLVDELAKTRKHAGL